MNARGPSVTRTFDLTSCRDMLGAFERALRRLAAAKHRQDLCDHGFYAALTAWHLIDWVWADLSRDVQTHARVAKDAGIRPPEFDKKAFTQWLLDQCRDLRYCGILANSSKHSQSKSRSGDPTFDAGATIFELAVEGEPYRAFWELSILEDGQRISAVEVFQRVEYFWTQLIYRYGIDEPQEPLPSEIANG